MLTDVPGPRVPATESALAAGTVTEQADLVAARRLCAVTLKQKRRGRQVVCRLLGQLMETDRTVQFILLHAYDDIPLRDMLGPAASVFGPPGDAETRAWYKSGASFRSIR